MNDHYDDVNAALDAYLTDERRSQEKLILAAMRSHPKRRGELRAEWERRLLRVVGEKA